MAFLLCLLLNKRQSHLIMKLHKRKVRGRCASWYTISIKNFTEYTSLLDTLISKDVCCECVINIKLGEGKTVTSSFFNLIHLSIAFPQLCQVSRKIVPSFLGEPGKNVPQIKHFISTVYLSRKTSWKNKGCFVRFLQSLGFST